MESETLADLSSAMASPVPGAGKRRVAGSTISVQTEEESQFLSTLTQQIEDYNKESSSLRSKIFELERRISEKRAALPSTEKPPLKITKQIILAFVEKLENAYQYFDFKDHVVSNKLLDPLPLSGPDSNPRPFIKKVVKVKNLQHKFNKLSTRDLKRALRACINDRTYNESAHYRNLSLRHLQKQHGYEEGWSDDTPSKEEIERFTEIFPFLRLPTPEEMKETRGDCYVASNPILNLVKEVREGSYVMDENLVVELHKLMKSHLFESFFDEFNSKRVPTLLEESITKEIDDLLSEVKMLNAEIFALEVKKVQNRIEKNKIERVRQLKFNSTKLHEE